MSAAIETNNLASHILGEVARLAHRIGIIHQGRLIQELDGAEVEQFHSAG
jgi:ABC-2 type transport system ATP-binding protein